MSTSAYITPEILEWARERAGMTVSDLAISLKVSTSNVQAWERGAQRPTFSKAEAIAKRLRIPFGYLFLSKRPADDIPLPDLRTETGARPEHPTLDFIDIVQNTLLKQQWFSDYLQEVSSNKLDYVGSVRTGSDVIKTAEAMRKWLGINHQMRERCTNWEQFKTEFVRQAEAIGVLVMRSGVAGANTRPLAIREFRGFAIVDSFAPVVFINSRDAKSAQIFTLAHELVHIWLGESGVSNPDPTKRSTEEHNRIEKFCNKVAAELLVPSAGVAQQWDSQQTMEANVQRLVRTYKVSRYVVARQVYELDKINRNQYLDYLDQHQNLWKPKDVSDEESGGNFYVTFFARNSLNLVAGVVRALGEDRISYRDASKLLSVKTAILKKIADRLA
ncbi:MAG: XRE family transcriptional regulator [Candidatus Sulfotelmatobacter sp.]|jgi:Zn-dependent peptidase ImmA (M78 family)/DNA-binding XRE family transcriptional regulator